MSFYPWAERRKARLDDYRKRAYSPEGREGSGLSEEARSNLIAGLLGESELRDFLDEFPHEEELVRAEIARFVEWVARNTLDPEAGATAKPRAVFLRELADKLARYRQLTEMVRPFRRYLGTVWDLSSAALRPAVFDIWKWFERIQQEKAGIEDVARRLGQLHEAEKAHLEEKLAAAESVPREFPRAAKSTLVGVHESDDLQSLVSSEAALLSSPEVADLFYFRFAEKKLLTYDYQARDKDRMKRLPERRRARRRHQGPIILALDTSGSMQGWKEQQAKAFALAFIKIAFRQQRSVHVISFSGDVETLTLSPPQVSLGQVLHFLMLSFHAGTDIGKALEEGLRVLADEEFRRADLIFLTDAEALPFGTEQTAAMEAAREKGNRFYALVVGDQQEAELLKQLDHSWRYDGEHLMDVVRDLEPYRLAR